MLSISTQEVQKIPSSAELYLARITAILDSTEGRYGPTQQPQAAVLTRLKTNLAAAVNTYEAACQKGASPEVLTALKADLLWQCNQCDYYLDRRLVQPVGSPREAAKNAGGKAAIRQKQGLWQIRLAVLAAFQFKLLTCVRRVMPGANTTGLAWRDLVPGLRLCLLAFLRGH